MINSVLNRSYEWFKSKRPVGWTKKMHLSNPTINCTTGAELKLAKAIARMMSV